MPKLPDIPAIGTSEASVGVRRVFDAIRRAFTDINKSGGVETGASVLDKIESAINAGAGASTTHTPPKPANVVATGGFAHIMVSWDDPCFIHLAYAEIWRSTGTEIADATRVGTTNATMFSDLPPSQSISVSYNYWVRFVSSDDTPQYGPWSDMVTASTADDPAYVLEILSQEIGETELDAALKSKLDGFVADAQELLATYGDTASAASSASAAVQAAADAVAAQNAASGYADTASQSATEASTSATSASGSASAANTSASQASASAGSAGDYASAASLSATTASTNSSSAGAYASNAATSANNAATSASNAATYASNSSGYAATAVSAASTATSAANSVTSQYTIKVDANGKVAGIGLWSSSTSSLVEVVADRFAICNTSGSGKKYPFVVDSTYGVVMDSALIKDGTITNAKIASLAADKLYASSGTIASAIIGTGQITSAMIGSYISSTNYNGSTSDPYNSPGSVGWCIAKGGGAAFNNVRVRGDIQATSVSANSITTNHLVSNAATSMAYGWTTAAGPTVLSAGNTYALTQCSLSVYGGLPVVIEAEYCAEATTSSANISMVIGIAKGNTSSLLISRNDKLLAPYAGAPVYILNGTRSIRFVDIPSSAGTYTYYVTLQVNGSVNTSSGVYNKYIRATEYRR